jgi:hypothetical protein
MGTSEVAGSTEVGRVYKNSQSVAPTGGEQGTLFIKKHRPLACPLKNEKSAASGAFFQGFKN